MFDRFGGQRRTVFRVNVEGSDVGELRRVSAEGTEFYAEIADTGGPETVNLDDLLSFDGVRETIQAIAESVTKAWEHVKPSEATIEFGLSLTAKQGKLTGLLVEGGGTATLNVTLAWKAGTAT